MKYEGSALDNLLNNSSYNTLSSDVKNIIQSKSITQYSWAYGDVDSISNIDLHILIESSLDPCDLLFEKVGTVGTYDRNVYALDIQDIVNYLGAEITDS